jgi:hypothetical protein
MDFFCPGCRKPFTSSRAVGGHRRHCEAYRLLPFFVFEQRRRNLDKAQAAADLAQRKAKDVPEVLVADIMEVEEQPKYRASSLRTQRSRLPLPKQYGDETPPIPRPVVQMANIHLDSIIPQQPA